MLYNIFKWEKKCEVEQKLKIAKDRVMKTKNDRNMCIFMKGQLRGHYGDIILI